MNEYIRESLESELERLEQSIEHAQKRRKEIQAWIDRYQEDIEEFRLLLSGLIDKKMAIRSFLEEIK